MKIAPSISLLDSLPPASSQSKNAFLNSRDTNISGEIAARHGTVCDISRIEPFDKVVSYAPMEELFGFTTKLRSLSSGHSAISMKLLGYSRKSQREQKI